MPRDAPHSDHYRSASGIEPIDLIRDIDFPEGNVIKLVARHESKDGLKDLEKALWYLLDIMKHKYNYVPHIDIKQERQSTSRRILCNRIGGCLHLIGSEVCCCDTDTCDSEFDLKTGNYRSRTNG